MVRANCSNNSPEIKRLLKEKVLDLFSKHTSGESCSDLKIFRIETEVEKIDSLGWLSNQDSSVKAYWSDRDHSLETAGIGEIDVVRGNEPYEFDRFINVIKDNLKGIHPDIKYYGGVRFNDSGIVEDIWKPFGAYRFWIPGVELITEKNSQRIACNFKISNSVPHDKQTKKVIDSIENIDLNDRIKFSADNELIRREDCPGEAEWYENVEESLRAIINNEFDKIVLARRTAIEYSENINPLHLLKKIKEINPDSFHYYFQPEREFAFVGGSPERLYKRNDKVIKSEAIAGTRLRGENKERDEELETELLNCEKDLLEHKFVYLSVKNSLEDLCEDGIMEDNLKVTKLARLQHLFISLQGTLSNGTLDSGILTALHPTPAVGGFPTDPALKKLESLETFDRGWYAGPVGWIGSDNAEFAVAIRSGLVHKNKLSLFSGAGIVTGSKPEEEWDEIENKIKNFLKAFNGK
ncbi:isochorismate synthase MenF [candidate division KSB1 bacterium]